MRLGSLLRRLFGDPVRPDEMLPVRADAYHFAAEIQMLARKLDQQQNGNGDGGERRG